MDCIDFVGVRKYSVTPCLLLVLLVLFGLLFVLHVRVRVVRPLSPWALEPTTVFV